jgi:hypothetical protein
MNHKEESENIKENLIKLGTQNKRMRLEKTRYKIKVYGGNNEKMLFIISSSLF